MRVSYWAWSVTWGYLIGPGLLHEGILLGPICYMRVSYWAWSVTWGYLIGPDLLHEGILLGLVCYMRVSYWAWSVTWGCLIGPDLLHEGILLGLVCYMRVSYSPRHLSLGMAIHVGLEATRFVNSDWTAAFMLGFGNLGEKWSCVAGALNVCRVTGGTGWSWVVSCTPRPLNPLAYTGGLIGTRGGLDVSEKRKFSCP